MTEVVEGEIVAELVRPAGQPVDGGILGYHVHYVDLPNGGRIEGMGQPEALFIARTLGTRAYRARAVLLTCGPQAGLVVVEVPVRIS